MKLSNLFKQTAVYWSTPDADGYGGFTFADPIEIKVRWEEKQEKFVSKSGDEIISQSVVYSETDFEVGGYLMLGTLNDLDSLQDPQTEAEAYLIQGRSKIFDTKNIKSLKKVWL